MILTTTGLLDRARDQRERLINPGSEGLGGTEARGGMRCSVIDLRLGARGSDDAAVTRRMGAHADQRAAWEALRRAEDRARRSQ